MFDLDRRTRALLSDTPPSVAVARMILNGSRFVAQPQALKPAGRPSVKPWADSAMPTQQRQPRKPRQPRQPKPRPTFSPAVAAALAEYQRSRAAHQATG
jgi:hypothetical protein